MGLEKITIATRPQQPIAETQQQPAPETQPASSGVKDTEAPQETNTSHNTYDMLDKLQEKCKAFGSFDAFLRELNNAYETESGADYSIDTGNDSKETTETEAESAEVESDSENGGSWKSINEKKDELREKHDAYNEVSIAMNRLKRLYARELQANNAPKGTEEGATTDTKVESDSENGGSWKSINEKKDELREKYDAYNEVSIAMNRLKRLYARYYRNNQ